MMDRLGTSEFTALQHLELMTPYGERGAWLRHAVLCSILVNIHRDKSQPAAEIDDFMPESLRSKPPAADPNATGGILAFFEMAQKIQEAKETADAHR